MARTGLQVKHGVIGMVPRIDAEKLAAGDAATLAALRHGATEVGFLTLANTALTQARVRDVLAAYGAFFHLPVADKRRVDMAATGSNRGWGAGGSEQVDPAANPDYKEVFDCGVALPPDDPQASLSVYAPNLWPARPSGFQALIEGYFTDARQVALQTLTGIARAIGRDPGHFVDQFARPMALLRGNFYPARPAWAGGRDFGIAAHTDYGCLTLLATDGQAGLEVQLRDGSWQGVQAAPGTFIINFGEMLEIWSGGVIRATPHRVVGGTAERLSVPLFFNPSHDTNVAPEGAPQIRAGDHLSARYTETYRHLQGKA